MQSIHVIPHISDTCIRRWTIWPLNCCSFCRISVWHRWLDSALGPERIFWRVLHSITATKSVLYALSIAIRPHPAGWNGATRVSMHAIYVRKAWPKVSSTTWCGIISDGIPKNGITIWHRYARRIWWTDFDLHKFNRIFSLSQMYKSHFERAVNPTNLAMFINSYIHRTDLHIARTPSGTPQASSKTLKMPVINITGALSPHADDTVTFNGRLDPTNSSWMKVGYMPHTSFSPTNQIHLFPNKFPTDFRLCYGSRRATGEIGWSISSISSRRRLR